MSTNKRPCIANLGAPPHKHRTAPVHVLDETYSANKQVLLALLTQEQVLFECKWMLPHWLDCACTRVEATETMCNTLIWLFVFPFCREATDVHTMPPHVINNVSVVVDLWLHATWKHSQVQDMMVSDGILQHSKKTKYTISKKKNL